MRILISIIAIILFLVPCLGHAQIISKPITDTFKTPPTIGSKITLQKSQPLVTVKEVEYVGIDGKTVIQKVAENDVGITIHHHWIKYPTEARTSIKIGKSSYTGVSTFDKDGNESFTVDKAPVNKEIEVKK